MPVFAKRMNQLPPYIFSSIGDEIRTMTQQGEDIIRLDIGNPDHPPPDIIVEALAEAARQPDAHGYSGYRGLAAFRQAVAQHYQTRFGVTLDPDREVLPLVGSKEGIINLILAYVDHDDVVLIPDAGYPSYTQGTLLAGGKPYHVPMDRESFLPCLDDVPSDILQSSRILWVNYPNNPTGAVADLAFYQKAVDFCIEHDILLASDNPYVDVTYDNYVAPSVMQATGAQHYAVEFFSFSKSYNMAGWRLGAVVGSSDAISNLLKIKSNIDSGHFIAIYQAGITALKADLDEWMAHRNAIYQRRRDKIIAALDDIGLTARTPQASLYIWARTLHDTDAAQYVTEARQQAHVSLAPGIAYGPGGENYIRISVSVPDERLSVALDRLKTWYAART